MERIDLNCDLGESFGAYTIGMDSEVLPYITSANIACGFHGGDPLAISSALGAGIWRPPRMRSGPISPIRQGRFWPSAMNRACA